MKIKTLIAALAPLALSAANPAWAGAGANFQVCLNLAKAPQQSLNVAVTVGTKSNSTCMNKYGENAYFQVTAAGLTCASIGYAEESGSVVGSCDSKTSYWPVSYSMSGQPYGGSTKISMSAGTEFNSATLSDSSSNTSICNSEAACNGTSVQWRAGTQGPLYVIFEPSAN